MNKKIESAHSAIVSPQGSWWSSIPKQEKIWITVAFIWCMILFAMMPLWHIKGGQNVSGIRHKVDPAAYEERVKQFVKDYQVERIKRIPVVEPPPGSQVYLMASMWRWYPILRLEKGVEYTLHLSSLDVNHGFGLFPLNINFQVIPGYDYALKITPSESGDFRIICNEFCGIGHHRMIGKIEVVDKFEKKESL